jgi:hypothetical protein
MKIGKAERVFGVYADKIYGCHSLLHSKKKRGQTTINSCAPILWETEGLISNFLKDILAVSKTAKRTFWLGISS